MGAASRAVATPGQRQPRPYRQSPLLVKPGKRSMQEALPTALHMGLSVGFSLLVFGIINICVTELLGPKNVHAGLVQKGTMMAMITVTVLGTPNLGNSLTKAFQRITGVMVGGWLFFGLYAACQEWWFLVICLAVWGFVLVASSFALSGREFLFPTALVTAFIVVCNFNTVHQALTMTLVKTVAFSGAIVLYTLVSLLMFPLTATQQLLTNLAIALRDIEQLADSVLVTGGKSAQASADTGGSTDSKDLQHPAAADAAAAPDSMQAKAVGGADEAAAAGKAGRAGKKGRKLPAAQPSVAVSLAADANHKLQLVQQLLRMTRKERYICTLGSYRCFMPTMFLKQGVLPEAEVLAVVVNAGQVLRVLTTIMSEFGDSAMAKRPPPKSVGGQAAQHTLTLSQQAVAALQDISAGLPVTGPSSYPMPIGNLQAYSDTLQQLVAHTVHADSTPEAAAAAAAPGQPPAASADGRVLAEAGGAAGSAPAPVGRWQQAAVAATGLQLPAQRPQQLAHAFSALLSESVSEESHMARWCSMLVMSRQLGRSVAGLNDSVNEMLAKLPWMSAGAAL